MTRQQVPDVTDADVERIVRRDFREEQVTEVLEILAEYGTEDWHRDHARVRLAVLKLADRSVAQLRREADTATKDYRDVLGPAEFPGYMRRSPGTNRVPPAELRQVIDADWKQYMDWLRR